jgi:hypothetical protein
MSKPMILVICVVIALIAVPILVKVVRPAPVTPSAPVAAEPAAPASPAAVPPPVVPPGTPVVVTFDPPNGATDVSPSKTELRVTFNCPMAPGFSWCGGGPQFPTITQNQKPWWTPDRKTCVLPVTLQPNWSYECGLNAPSFHNFKSESGVALVPVLYRFSTGPA